MISLETRDHWDYKPGTANELKTVMAVWGKLEKEGFGSVSLSALECIVYGQDSLDWGGVYLSTSRL